jgi:predicted tellurium resistance membrane protein TerC
LSGHALIVLVGGVFLIYTAMKEIYHLLGSHDLGDGKTGKATRTVQSALIWIVLMNIVFSFDTVLSAVALTKNFPVMVGAIIISGILMVVMADAVANFLKKNRMYEVLGLFVLLLVGVMLMSEGGHLAHLTFFGFPIEPMAKSTFYFVLFTLVAVDVVQGRYQKKILEEAGPGRGKRWLIWVPMSSKWRTPMAAMTPAPGDRLSSRARTVQTLTPPIIMASTVTRDR